MLRSSFATLAFVASGIVFGACSSDATQSISPVDTTGGPGGSASGTSGTAGSPNVGAGGDAITSGTGVGGGASGSSSTAGAMSSSEAGIQTTDASSIDAPPNSLPRGPSKGCGTAAGADNAKGFTLHAIDIPGVDPNFAPGGAAAQSNGGYSFVHRNYALRLPDNYDPAVPHPLVVGGGGCGGGPVANGAGMSLNSTGAIMVGLSYLNQCFADGGTSCAGSVKNEPMCVNTPEVQYFKTMLDDVESKFCVDRSKVFLAGYSSGAWEAYTLGCALANVIRGIGADEGGMRVNRPACTGPVAAMLVAGEADTENPIGPAATIDSGRDSFGSAPGRDDILKRNGCDATKPATVWDPKYPACKQYSCPAAFPVVWCSLPGVGHNSSKYGGVDYSPGGMWSFLSSLPAIP